MSSEALPIAGHEYTHKYDGHRYVSNAVASETLPDAVALVRLPDVEAVRAQWAAEVAGIKSELDAMNLNFDGMREDRNKVRFERDSAQAEAKAAKEALRLLIDQRARGVDQLSVGAGLAWAKAQLVLTPLQPGASHDE